MHGNNESRDYSHMYNIADRPGPHPLPVIDADSILGYLTAMNHPFATVLRRSPFAGVLNDPQASFTLFVPEKWDQTLLPFAQRQMILAHSLAFHAPPEFLASRQSMLLNTRIPGTQIHAVTRGGKTTVNGVPLQSTATNGNAVVYFIGREMRFFPTPQTNNVI